MRLMSSWRDGKRQPFRPPMFLLTQKSAARPYGATGLLQARMAKSGACSHTSPVSRSKTAALLKSANTTNRLSALGMMLLQDFRLGCSAPAGPARTRAAAMARVPRAHVMRRVMVELPSLDEFVTQTAAV